MSQDLSYSTRDQLVDLIKAFGGSGNYIVIPRLFFDLTGDLSQAGMLSQLIYWSDRSSRVDGFVYKSSSDWYVEVGASDYAVRKFKKLPFIETKVLKANGSPTTYYRVKFDILLECIYQLLPKKPESSPNENDEIDTSISRNHGDIQSIPTDEPFEKDGSLTETITKNTTENTNIEGCTPLEINRSTSPLLVSFNSRSEKTRSTSQVLVPIPPEFREFTDVLAEVTGFDISLKPSAARLMIVSRELLHSGYTKEDLNNFLDYWMANDWRWKKDKQLPSPEDVLAHIFRSKNQKKIKRGKWLGQ